MKRYALYILTGIAIGALVVAAGMFTGCAKLKELYQKETAIEQESVPWDSVTVCVGNDDATKWAETLVLVVTGHGKAHIDWTFTGDSPESKGWKPTHAISKNPIASIGYVVEMNGKWFTSTPEWVPPNCRRHDLNHVIHKGLEKELEGFDPKGKTIYVFICGLNRVGQRNVQERSNFVPIQYKGE